MISSLKQQKKELSVRNLVLRAIPIELLGTFALCYVGGLACAMSDNSMISLNGVALAHGGILALMVYIGADISGGYYNPAVCIGMFLLQKEDFLKMMMYSGAQILGGMLAGAFITFDLSSGWVHNMLKKNNSVLGYPNTNALFDRWQSFLGEMISTMVFMLAIILATEKWKFKPERKGHYALSICLILTTAIYGIGKVSGGALNPARMIGPMIVSGTIQTVTTPYIAGTIAGAVIASFFYRTFLDYGDKFTEEKEYGAIDGGNEGKQSELDKKLRDEYEKQKAE